MTRARWMPLALAFGLAAAARAQTEPGGSAQEAGRPVRHGAPARRVLLGHRVRIWIGILNHLFSERRYIGSAPSLSGQLS